MTVVTHMWNGPKASTPEPSVFEDNGMAKNPDSDLETDSEVETLHTLMTPLGSRTCMKKGGLESWMVPKQIILSNAVDFLDVPLGDHVQEPTGVRGCERNQMRVFLLECSTRKVLQPRNALYFRTRNIHGLYPAGLILA